MLRDRYVIAVWLLRGCCVVAAYLLCGCHVVAVWLLCDCFVVAAWLLRGCCVVTAWWLYLLHIAAAGTVANRDEAHPVREQQPEAQRNRRNLTTLYYGAPQAAFT